MTIMCVLVLKGVILSIYSIGPVQSACMRISETIRDVKWVKWEQRCTLIRFIKQCQKANTAKKLKTSKFCFCPYPALVLWKETKQLIIGATFQKQLNRPNKEFLNSRTA